MPRAGHRLAVLLFIAVIGVWLAVMAVVMRLAALPPEASGTMLAVFEPGMAPDDVFARLTQAGARPVKPSAFPFIWVVNDDAPGLAGRLVAAGALGTYRDLPLSPTIAGCFAYADATIASWSGS